MQNIYSSDYWTQVRQDEQNRGNQLFAQAQDPFKTGVVPLPAHSAMFSGISELSGQPETFTHNNMQPYYSGSVKQNLDPFANASRLEAYTGRGELLQNKQEVQCFFEPTKDLGNICGMESTAEFVAARVEAPKRRNNEFPIDQVRVGPGLGLGYTAAGRGGFQQASTLDVIRPKDVNELRAGSRPKLVNQGRITGAPKAVVTTRGNCSEVAKNRPDKFWEQKPDQWLRTTGAFKKQMEQAAVNLKPTARVDGNVEYSGVAGPGQRRGQGSADDYGKATVMVYDNERATTQTRTVITNVQAAVKAIVMPFLDIMRHTPKEYTIDAPREYGNMQAQMPSKATVYDPVNHMMRTTIKETTLHDAAMLNLQGPKEGRREDPEAMKVTTRETTPVVDTTRNIASHTYRVIIYNPDDAAKTTLRELITPASNPSGYVGGDVTRKGAYTHIDVQVPATQKQYLSDVCEYGIAGAQNEFRERSREAEENAEIDGTREMLNIAVGRTPNSAKATNALDASQVDMQHKKLVSDALATRTAGNVSYIYQPTVAGIGDVTKLANVIPNAVENRLDPATLSSLKSNPYNLSINNIG